MRATATKTAALAGRPETSLYTPILGLPHLRQKLAARMSMNYGCALDASAVAITAGCNHAFCLAISALAGAGDEVLLPVPYYFNYQMWLDMQGIRALHLPFREARGALPDPADAAALITPRTRAIVLVTPNNRRAPSIRRRCSRPSTRGRARRGARPRRGLSGLSCRGNAASYAVFPARLARGAGPALQLLQGL